MDDEAPLSMKLEDGTNIIFLDPAKVMPMPEPPQLPADAQPALSGEGE